MSLNKNLEYKSATIAIKSFDSLKGIFKGYASSFNNVDKVNDTVYPEAFDNSIEQFNAGTKQISVNYDHFYEIELCANLISISKDENGLLVEFQISDEAKEIYSELYAEFIVAVETGKLFMSIGGYILKSKLGEDRWMKKMVANANDFIEEFDLEHVAITKWPIDSNAKMLEVKSRNQKALPVEDYSNLNKLISAIDGKVSAAKFLVTYKSQISNTSAKNFVNHCKNLWKKDLDNKEVSITKSENEEILGDESRGDNFTSRSGSDGGIDLSMVAKYLN